MKVTGEEASRMEEVTFRLPEDELRQLELAAEAALMNRSEYIRFLLRGRPVHSDVGLAALRRLIQIHELARSGSEESTLALTLRELVPILAKAVRHRLV